jgi:hypothetical protein
MEIMAIINKIKVVPIVFTKYTCNMCKRTHRLLWMHDAFMHLAGCGLVGPIVLLCVGLQWLRVTCLSG